MAKDKVSQYILLLNKALNLRQQGLEEGENDVLDKLDLIWYSFNPSERDRANAAAAVLKNYYSI